MKRHFTAQTPQQAQLLQDSRYFNILGRLLTGEASASEVAHDTAQPLKQVHHKLTRLLQAGLIEVRGERSRGGRPVKIYGAVASGYRVPFALTDAATLGDLVRTNQQPLLDIHYGAIGRVQGADILVRLNELGRMELTLDATPVHSSVVMHSAFLGYRLGPEAVQELQQRLVDLSQWLEQQGLKKDDNGEDYLLGLMLTPGRVMV